MAEILKLSDDVLCTIFYLNAHSHNDYPSHGNYMIIYPQLPPEGCILTTLRTSQVCQSWRNAILSSPAIWALLIDLNALFTRPSLRDLVAGRASTAPMWVRGADQVLIMTPRGAGVVSTGYVKNDTLLPFLKARWSQIRRLNLELFTENSAHDLLDILGREAPLLEDFEIKHLHIRMSLIPSSTKPIFNGRAPRLQRFNCSLYPLDFNANWLSHLQDLTFFNSDSFPPIQLPSFLRRMGSMSKLHSLRLDLPNVVKGHATHSPGGPISISLHQLKSFDFQGSVTACTAFLEVAGAVPGSCAPKMTVLDFHEDLTSSATSNIANRFLDFTNAYTQYGNYPLKKLVVIYSRGFLQLEASAGYSVNREEFNHKESLFTLAFVDRVSESVQSISVLPDRFCGMINCLSLLLDSMSDSPEILQSEMAQMLGAFTSVTHLYTSPQTGLFLNRYAKDQRLFPVLEVVMGARNGFGTSNDWIFEFQRLRGEISYPSFQIEYV